MEVANNDNKDKKLKKYLHDNLNDFFIKCILLPFSYLPTLSGSITSSISWV